MAADGKFSIMMIQVNVCCPVQASPGISTKFNVIVYINFFAIHLPSHPFLGHGLDFTTFITLSFLTIFHSLDAFVDI